jgi:dienelactone hydrolase
MLFTAVIASCLIVPLSFAELQDGNLSDQDTSPASAVSTVSADGVELYGDHYRSGDRSSPTVVLFHQAGGDARGEYGGIARRLVQEGFEVFAWDARSGGNRFGQTNRTVTARGSSEDSYCAAYPDLEAALAYVILNGSGGPVITVGSSYSAALVIRLAAEHADSIAATAAFSPASGRMEDCAVNAWLEEAVAKPLLVFRPEAEMENASVALQAESFKAHGVELVIAPDASHGASMLNPDRNQGDVGKTWDQLLKFINTSIGR